MDDLIIPLPDDLSAEGLASWALVVLVGAMVSYGLPLLRAYLERAEARAEKALGFEIDDRLAAGLHRTLENGVRKALAEGAHDRDDIVGKALAYARAHSPDTVAHWASRGADLRDIAAAHLPTKESR